MCLPLLLGSTYCVVMYGDAGVEHAMTKLGGGAEGFQLREKHNTECETMRRSTHVTLWSAVALCFIMQQTMTSNITSLIFVSEIPTK